MVAIFLKRECFFLQLDFHKGILKPEEKEDPVVQPSAPQNRLPPLMPERDRERDRERDKDKEWDRERDRGAGGVRDLWAEREKEMQRRERARGEREWDRDKVREFARPGEEERRSRSRDRERRRRERGKSKERKADKKGKFYTTDLFIQEAGRISPGWFVTYSFCLPEAEKADEPPAKLLDDLFLKTKAAPCIYWLPLTEEQVSPATVLSCVPRVFNADLTGRPVSRCCRSCWTARSGRRSASAGTRSRKRRRKRSGRTRRKRG